MPFDCSLAGGVHTDRSTKSQEWAGCRGVREALSKQQANPVEGEPPARHVTALPGIAPEAGSLTKIAASQFFGPAF